MKKIPFLYFRFVACFRGRFTITIKSSTATFKDGSHCIVFIGDLLDLDLLYPEVLSYDVYMFYQTAADEYHLTLEN